MVDRAAASEDWTHVAEVYPVPPQLHDHQLDAMSLLKQGKHVFLGNLGNLKNNIIQPIHF